MFIPSHLMCRFARFIVRMRLFSRSQLFYCFSLSFGIVKHKHLHIASRFLWFDCARFFYSLQLWIVKMTGGNERAAKKKLISESEIVFVIKRKKLSSRSERKQEMKLKPWAEFKWTNVWRCWWSRWRNGFSSGTGTRGEVLDRQAACFPSVLIISMAHSPNFRQLSSLLSTLIYICLPLSPQTAAAFRFIMFHNIHLAHVEEPRENIADGERKFHRRLWGRWFIQLNHVFVPPPSSW